MPRELGGIEVGFFAALSEMIARPLAGIAAKGSMIDAILTD
jgi:hypothetical protein